MNSFWKAKVVKKKNLSWSQAKKRYPKLKPFGDADKDGVKNRKDCRPFNRKKQHVAGSSNWIDAMDTFVEASNKSEENPDYEETREGGIKATQSGGGWKRRRYD